jgi:hypothetical protein
MAQQPEQCGRVGIRGYRVTGEGILYAAGPRAALRKLGEDLIEASKETDLDKVEIKTLVRGGLQLQEL